MYQRAWRATNVTEQPYQHSDWIRYVDQGREHRNQSLEHLVIEGRKRGVEHHLSHEQPALGEGLARVLALPGLHLGQALPLPRQFLLGGGFRFG